MRIKVERKVFAQAIAEVAPFASAKAPIAILKNAKITTKGNRMKIEANDTQCSMVKYIELFECDQDGTFLIDMAEMNKYVAKIKDPVIDIDVAGDTIRIRHSKGSAEFATDNADEFPVFKMPDKESTEIQVDTRLLSEAISKGKNFVSTEIIRPQMCAIYAYIEDGEFGYCATDTHKMVWGRYPMESEAKVSFLIMAPIFSALLTACKSADIAKIQITDTHAQYTIGSVRIQTVLAKGNYPNFKRVIPQNWNMECGVEKSDLMESLGRVSLFCDNSECIKLDITEMDMCLSVDNLEYMKKSAETLAHGGCNGRLAIGVNARHLSSCLSVFDGGEVVMKMGDASRPILFNAPDNNNIGALAMPMRINNE